MSLFGNTLSADVVQEMSRLFTEVFGLNHVYGYAKQNSVMLTDPYGLLPPSKDQWGQTRLIRYYCWFRLFRTQQIRTTLYKEVR